MNRTTPSTRPLQRFYLLAVALVVFLGCWVAPIDTPARAQVEDGLKLSLIHI